MKNTNTPVSTSHVVKQSLRFGPNSEKRGLRMKLLTASIVAALYPVMPALAQDGSDEARGDAPAIYHVYNRGASQSARSTH